MAKTNQQPRQFDYLSAGSFDELLKAALAWREKNPQAYGIEMCADDTSLTILFTNDIPGQTKLALEE